MSSGVFCWSSVQDDLMNGAVAPIGLARWLLHRYDESKLESLRRLNRLTGQLPL